MLFSARVDGIGPSSSSAEFFGILSMSQKVCAMWCVVAGCVAE